MLIFKSTYIENNEFDVHKIRTYNFPMKEDLVMFDYEDIKVEVCEHIAVITLNRPAVLNAMRMQTKHELENAVDALDADSDVYGVIITGAGKAFAAGSDINEISVDREGSETQSMSAAAHVLMNKIENMGKPVLAAINGYALGGGLELALACDLRIAGKRAKMGVPEVELGVAPCYGGTQRLPRLIGTGRAKEMLFTGKKVNAEEAYRIGLVERIAESDDVMDDARAFMQEIVRMAPIAVRYNKKCVNEGMKMSLEEGLALEAEVAGVLVETKDAAEGVRAFLEKRKPVFSNH